MFPVFCHSVARFLHFIIFFSVLPWCYSISPSYPYVTPVRRTLTQMHLPQSLQLHRINGFARFFHGFLSVRLLHSGHTSKRPFFHCFSNVSRVLYVTCIILPSPQCFHRCNQFSKRSTQIFHCFPILFPLFYVIFPHLFIVYSTIPTVAPHKRFCSFLPWFSFRASTP